MNSYDVRHLVLMTFSLKGTKKLNQLLRRLVLVTFCTFLFDSQFHGKLLGCFFHFFKISIFGPFWTTRAIFLGPKINFLKYGPIIYRWKRILTLISDFDFVLPNFHFGPFWPFLTTRFWVKNEISSNMVVSYIVGSVF